MGIDKFKLWAAGAVLLIGGQAFAEVSALVAIEPTSRNPPMLVTMPSVSWRGLLLTFRRIAPS